MSYESIQSQINALKIDADEALMDQLNILHNQLIQAGNAKWTRGELIRLVQFEDDILDSGVIEEETALWDEIREIQHNIINYFGS